MQYMYYSKFEMLQVCEHEISLCKWSAQLHNCTP